MACRSVADDTRPVHDARRRKAALDAVVQQIAQPQSLAAEIVLHVLSPLAANDPRLFESRDLPHCGGDFRLRQVVRHAPASCGDTACACAASACNSWRSVVAICSCKLRSAISTPAMFTALTGLPPSDERSREPSNALSCCSAAASSVSAGRDLPFEEIPGRRLGRHAGLPFHLEEPAQHDLGGVLGLLRIRAADGDFVDARTVLAHAQQFPQSGRASRQAGDPDHTAVPGLSRHSESVVTEAMPISRAASSRNRGAVTMVQMVFRASWSIFARWPYDGAVSSSSRLREIRRRPGSGRPTRRSASWSG